MKTEGREIRRKIDRGEGEIEGERIGGIKGKGSCFDKDEREETNT